MTTESAKDFFGQGVFDWQLVPKDLQATWRERSYNEDRWWGDFSRDGEVPADMFAAFPWAIGPFTKYPGNPVLSPTPGAWDQGHAAGGVHNGAILRHDGRFCYIYRGERPIDVPTKSEINYIGDVGLAVSDDGIHFTKDDDCSPFFRKGPDRRYSYEDVCLVRHGDSFHLFCNQWLWEDMLNPAVCGVFTAVSPDLRHWQKLGIVFPKAKRIHRNPVVVQNPDNEAVRVSGKFVMYINDGLMAYSDDLVHWEAGEIEQRWPGGEGAFAIAGHDASRPDDLVLFTGGHHTGHFYGMGEVLFSQANPEKPLAWLPRPVLAAEKRFSYEDGFSAEAPHRFISCWADTVFFTGMTRYREQWMVYYGGSEYYTCLATAPAHNWR
jgi:predicted GH43/DUF377 family glycosyl hydrolase